MSPSQPSLLALHALREINLRSHNALTAAAQAQTHEGLSALLSRLASLHAGQVEDIRRLIGRRTSPGGTGPARLRVQEIGWADFDLALGAVNPESVFAACEFLERTVLRAYQNAHGLVPADRAAQRLIARHHEDVHGALVFIDTVRRKARRSVPVAPAAEPVAEPAAEVAIG